MTYEKIFLDANDNIVSEEEAAKVIYQEIDENGNLVKESFYFTDKYPREEDERVKNHVLSEETKKTMEAIHKLLEEDNLKTK